MLEHLRFPQRREIALQAQISDPVARLTEVTILPSRDEPKLHNPAHHD